jgi:hypothetical protein
METHESSWAQQKVSRWDGVWRHIPFLADADEGTDIITKDMRTLSET